MDATSLINILQIRASNPQVGAWVSASAGTGKTKILTDRVIRLLLENVDPSKILCITFTNAAAGEMQDRILQKLSELAESSLNKRKDILLNITGQIPTEQQLINSSLLYENYLKSEMKINIHTLHSYCQKILQKFPLEAGVIPSFSILDETDMQDAIASIRMHLLNDKRFLEINKFFAENFHPNTIDEIFKDILQEGTKFHAEQESGLEFVPGIIEQLKEYTNSEYTSLLEYPLLQKIIGFNFTTEDLKNFFLTKNGEPRKRVGTSKIAKAGSSTHDELLRIQERVYMLDQQDRTLCLENFSKLIHLCACQFLSLYDKYKANLGSLDYDDLIIKTKNLLIDNESRSWVLYKLDGGIEHILVDEAQDTSPEQWVIIEALLEEFFVGETNSNNITRTIFVVGDEKQSIFSFQGADISSFLRMNQHLVNKVTFAQKNFENINLEISYRSCPEILDVVYELFSNLSVDFFGNSTSGANSVPYASSTNMPEASFPRGLVTNNQGQFRIPKISAYRSSHSGKLELWNLCKPNQEEDSFWQSDKILEKETQSAEQILADKIAEYISQEIANKSILPATGKPARASDFMILFRTRSKFTNEVISALHNKNVETGGLDRIRLADDLLIKDLISMARYALNPLDKLNEAALAKSPLISELGQYDLCKQIIIILYKNGGVRNFFHNVIEQFNVRTIGLYFYNKTSLESLDELLKLIKKYCQNKGHSLFGFVEWFDKQELEVKRETDKLDMVKIMTVHGSKGLQAPVVILCDTTTIPSQSSRFLWQEGNKLVTVKDSNFVPISYLKLREEEKKREYNEYLRLLYVAMTRAEDHLVVCGYSNKKNIPDNCWYELIRKTLEKMDIISDDDKVIYQRKDIVKDNIIIQQQDSELSKSTDTIFFTPTAINPFEIKNLDMKQPNGKNEINSSFVATPLIPKSAIEYGLVFHKILEDAFKTNSLQDIKKHPLIYTLNKNQQKRIINSIDNVLNNQEFICLINGGEIKTELSIGCHADSAEIGRIDMLVFKDKYIHIIDYKTDKNPAATISDVNQSYITQLSSYSDAMNIIFPDYVCKKYLLWLETGLLMQI